MSSGARYCLSRSGEERERVAENRNVDRMMVLTEVMEKLDWSEVKRVNGLSRPSELEKSCTSWFPGSSSGDRRLKLSTRLKLKRAVKHVCNGGGEIICRRRLPSDAGDHSESTSSILPALLRPRCLPHTFPFIR
ncbi:hypothetical protein F2P81_010020 [Scophthalmus maximus]|uniref:Uncharacterized protein n=1 Tax=Scophthalmus maximus TaxID=52904 RepID=A0A6A4SPT3_SCOMX|nr:hypothetical protein F2P81_010020 [Scophthalmus maximus]